MTLAIELLAPSIGDRHRLACPGRPPTQAHHAAQPTGTLGLSESQVDPESVKRIRSGAALRCPGGYASVGLRFYGPASRRPRAWPSPRRPDGCLPPQPAGRPPHRRLWVATREARPAIGISLSPDHPVRHAL